MSETESQASADLVELGFMDARWKVIDVAAFLDRVQRAGQDSDYRVSELKKALACLNGDDPERAKQMGRAARRRIETVFQWSDAAAQLVEVFEETRHAADGRSRAA